MEDLEALKELNDELEEGHIETEKQLAEEVGQLEPQRDWEMLTPQPRLRQVFGKRERDQKRWRSPCWTWSRPSPSSVTW